MMHGSLFSGIGGFEVAAECMGWVNTFHCEINPFGRTILNYYWPNSISYEDITKTDFTIHRGRIDILTGGFPCQPYSVAGKRKGKDDERHLWPQMLRAIREIQPRWVVGENVRGLINWNGGLVFDEVQADLEAAGYEVLPFLLPACGVNAPHRRDRIWFVAYANDNRKSRRTRKNEGEGKKERVQEWNKIQFTGKSDNLREVTLNNGEVGAIANGTDTGVESVQPSGENGIYGFNAVTNTSNERCNDRSHIRKERQIRTNERVTEENKSERDGRKCGAGKAGEVAANADSIQRCKGRMHQKESKKTKRHSGSCDSWNPWTPWANFPTQSPVCNGNDGLPTELLRQRIREDCMGCLSEEEIDKIISQAANEWRKESIKAMGNSVVPQVVLQIFKAIEQYDK